MQTSYAIVRRNDETKPSNQRLILFIHSIVRKDFRSCCIFVLKFNWKYIRPAGIPASVFVPFMFKQQTKFAAFQKQKATLVCTLFFLSSRKGHARLFRVFWGAMLLTCVWGAYCAILRLMWNVFTMERSCSLFSCMVRGNVVDVCVRSLLCNTSSDVLWAHPASSVVSPCTLSRLNVW